MKKKEIFYITLIIVLIGVVSIESYLIMSNKGAKTEITENNNNVENENNKEEEKITLSSKELKNYLKYIPTDIDGGVYRKEFSNIQNIDKNLLLDNLITNIVNDEENNFNNNKK